MANGLYAPAKDAMIRGVAAYNWTSTDEFRVLLVDTANYAVNLETHASLSDIPASARVSSRPITSRTTDGKGNAKGANVTFTQLTGPTVEALVVYRHTGTDSTSFLISYMDAAPNLPYTPNGGNLDIVWATAGIYGIN